MLLFAAQDRSSLWEEPSDEEREHVSLWEAFQYGRRLFGLIRPYWSYLLTSVGIGLLTTVIGMVPPYLSKLLFDQVYPAQDVSLLSFIVISILGIKVTTSVISAIQGYYVQYHSGEMGMSVGLMFFDHLQRLPVRFFHAGQVGEITSRYRDLNASIGTVTGAFQTVISNGVVLLLVPPFLFALNWQLALLAIAAIPLTAALDFWINNILRRREHRISETQADLNATQVEVFHNMHTLKTMRLEQHAYDRIERLSKNALQHRLRAGGVKQVFSIARTMIEAGQMALYSWVGWHFVLTQEITLGTFIAFGSYMRYMQGPLSQFAGLFTSLPSMSVAFERMFEYLEKPVEDVRPDGDTDLPAANGEAVRFENVRFEYPDGMAVFDDLNLSLPARAVTSIIGPSGCGKTTLLRMINRLYRPDGGTVSIHGTPADTMRLSALRKNVMVIPQNVMTMRGTVYENVSIGIEDPEDTAIEEALRVSQLWEYVEALPDGWDTAVGEQGARLSAGQRQRLALARGIVRSAPIMILDEATSNIDMETEHKILRDLYATTPVQTLIMVTHRLPTALLTDYVCDLGDGVDDPVLMPTAEFAESVGAADAVGSDGAPISSGSAARPPATPKPAA